MKSFIKISHKKGFTLIETLVAIAILMIAVAGPLVIANKALTAALYAKDQSTASYLAQEEMEIVKNTRDNALKNNLPWLTNLSCGMNGAHCDLTVIDDGTLHNSPPVDCGAGCPLYLGSKGYSSHDTSNSKTLFSRYFTLTKVDPDDDDYQVTVVVSWNEGTVPNAVTLHSEIVNALR